MLVSSINYKRLLESLLNINSGVMGPSMFGVHRTHYCLIFIIILSYQTSIIVKSQNKNDSTLKKTTFNSGVFTRTSTTSYKSEVS